MLNTLGKLLDKMQSAGVSLSGSDPTEEQKKALRDMGVEVYKKGGKVTSSASKRADGCAVRGKTKGRIV